MTTAQDAQPAASADIEVSSPVVWEAFILGEGGFVISTNEDIDEILALFPDEVTIDATYGDVFPTSIEIVSGTAMPQPQSPGSEFLRAPGSHYTEDKILEVDLEMFEDPESLILLWERCKAMAKALTEFEALRTPR